MVSRTFRNHTSFIYCSSMHEAYLQNPLLHCLSFKIRVWSESWPDSVVYEFLFHQKTWFAWQSLFCLHTLNAWAMLCFSFLSISRCLRFTISAQVFITTVWNLDKLNAQWSSGELVLFPSLLFKLKYNHSQNEMYKFRNTFCCTFTKFLHIDYSLFFHKELSSFLT